MSGELQYSIVGNKERICKSNRNRRDKGEDLKRTREIGGNWWGFEENTRNRRDKGGDLKRIREIEGNGWRFEESKRERREWNTCIFSCSS